MKLWFWGLWSATYILNCVKEIGKYFTLRVKKQRQQQEKKTKVKDIKHPFPVT